MIILGWSYLIVSKDSETILVAFLRHIRCVSWSTVLFVIVIVLESFYEPSKEIFPVRCSNELGSWLSRLH